MSVTRVPNKIGWALEDIRAAAHSARQAVAILRPSVDRSQNPAIVGALAAIDAKLADIEIRAIEARQGKYTP